MDATGVSIIILPRLFKVNLFIGIFTDFPRIQKDFFQRCTRSLQSHSPLRWALYKIYALEHSLCLYITCIKLAKYVNRTPFIVCI